METTELAKVLRNQGIIDKRIQETYELLDLVNENNIRVMFGILEEVNQRSKRLEQQVATLASKIDRLNEGRK